MLATVNGNNLTKEARTLYNTRHKYIIGKEGGQVG